MADLLSPQVLGLVGGAVVLAAGYAATLGVLGHHPATREIFRPPATPRRHPPSVLFTLDLKTAGLAAGAVVILLWAGLTVPGCLIPITALLGCTLLALAVSDLAAFVLPNVLTAFLCCSGLVACAVTMPDQLGGHLLGVLLGGGSLLLVSAAYRRWRGRDGLGLGDVKLLAAAGAWVSWSGLASVVLIGAAATLAHAVFTSLVSGRSLRNERQPFGTFLCLGVWLTWLYGPVNI